MRWLNYSCEYAKLATFCSRYLTSPPFPHGTSEEHVRMHANEAFMVFKTMLFSIGSTISKIA